MAGFCTNCGSSLDEGAAFCGSCGTPIEPSGAPAPPPVPVSAPPRPPANVTTAPRAAQTPPAAATPPPAKSGNVFLKVVTFVLAFFALVTVVGIGSCLYIGYRVKQKAEQLTEKVAQVKGKMAPVLPARTVKARACLDVDPSQSAAFRTVAASASIPFQPGLTLISIWTNPQKNAHDIEMLETVEEIDNNTVRVSLASTAEQTEYKHGNSARVLCIADLLNGRQYETAWAEDSDQLLAIPETVSGATMFSMSQAMFQDLKAARTSELEYYEAHDLPWSVNEYGLSNDFRAQLARVEPDDVPYSAIVNGERKDLPAIHVKSRAGETKVEAYILDDPANPITLNFGVPDEKSYIKYVKINYPVEKKLERDLSQGGCAAVYGIYFDFDSARLRSESGPALQEIADALGHNPAWRVKIDGHTDNIGGDDYNMTLSTRRAEAVAQALATKYQVSASRLSSEGFGARRPKGSNDTTEGRALNRRVELCRQ